MTYHLSIITLAILMSMAGIKAYGYDFSQENADGITIYYQYINDGKELEVTKDRMSGQYSGVVNIPETVTYMGKTRQVTSIGNEAFEGCENLLAVNIPNTVRTIKEMAFFDNQNLTSVSIGNSVESIESLAFWRCWSIETLVIPNSVVSIGSSAFRACSGIVNLTLGDNLETIGSYAFGSCKIKSLTLPSKITSIGKGAFEGTNPLSVKSLIKEPFEIEDDTFSDNTFYNVTLKVPSGFVDKYKNLSGWKRFHDIEGFDATDEGQTCATPTISYSKGKLVFTSATEGAVCHATITDSDITSYVGNEVELGVTYLISVYATKGGYEKSETITATLCWIDSNPQTEGIADGIANLPAHAVLITSKDGILDIQGIDDSANIAVYSVSGHLVGSTKANGKQASLVSNLKKGDIAIIKIGEKSVKIVIQ